MSSDHHLDVFGPQLARSRRRGAVMWAALALSVGLVAVVLVVRFGQGAWSIGALILMLSCFGVCGWAGITSQHDIDEAAEEAKRFAAERQAAEYARRSGRPGQSRP